MDETLLSRDESTAIKGCLILLVILGHNSILMAWTGLFQYLYTFHVYCFFILPFLYGCQPNSHWRKLLLRIGKYYLVYLLVSIFAVCAALCQGKIHWDAGGFSLALLTGNQILLGTHMGFGMLWFIPNICSVLLWHRFYFSMKPCLRLLSLFIGILLWIIVTSGYLEYPNGGRLVPCALFSGYLFSIAGMSSRYLLMKWRSSIAFRRLICLVACLFIPLWVFLRTKMPCLHIISWHICPVMAILAFYSVRDFLANCAWLIILGRHSFILYLMHVFIYNALLHISPSRSFVSGILLFFATIALSLLPALAIQTIHEKKKKNTVSTA